MTTQEERLQILRMLSDGIITAEEATNLLAVLGEGEEEEEAWEEDGLPEVDTTLEADPLPREDSVAGGRAPLTGTPPPPPDLAKWRRWWILPLGIGVGITTLSGLLLYAGIRAEWAGFWLACTWLPLLFGTLVIVLAWMSRTARWLHVRVDTGEDWPKRVAISFPLPIRMTAWALRTFGHWIPGLERTGIDEVIMALGDSATPEAPLYVEVDEGDGAERVQVYIG